MEVGRLQRSGSSRRDLGTESGQASRSGVNEAGKVRVPQIVDIGTQTPIVASTRERVERGTLKVNFQPDKRSDFAETQRQRRRVVTPRSQALRGEMRASEPGRVGCNLRCSAR